MTPVSLSPRSADQPASPAASSQVRSLSNKWGITVLKNLAKLDIFNKYVIGEKVELLKAEYEGVGWDQFKIHSVDQKKLYTTELGPCLGLTVRGYDETGQLSHSGIAHVFMKDNLHQKFFEDLRGKVKGRIELFIAGGMYRQDELLKKIIDDAKEFKIDVVDNVSKTFFKKVALIFKGMAYRGESGIAQLYFDSKFNPQIVADLLITGISDLEQVISDPACKLQLLPDHLL